MADNGPEDKDDNGRSGDQSQAEKPNLIEAIQSFERQHRCANKHRTDHDQKTLFWTKIAGFGVWFYSLLTCVIIVASIYSAIQAKVSADAAQTSARTAADTEVRQLRAYLYVRHFPIVADQTTAAAKVEINHAGVTPAYNIRLDAQIMVAPYLVGELRLPDVTSPNVSPVDRFQTSILYNTENFPKVISLPAYASEAMRFIWSKDPAIGDQRLYLFGVVRYFDIFGIEGLQPERRYEFCFVYHPERDPIGNERGCEKYNRPG